MATGELIHIASCAIEVQHFILMTAGHDVIGAASSVEDIEPSCNPSRHECRGRTAPGPDRDVAIDVDVPASIFRDAEFLQQTAQGVAQGVCLTFSDYIVESERVHVPEYGTGQFDLPPFHRIEFQVATAVHGHGNDGQAQIVLVFPEQTEPSRCRTDEGRSHGLRCNRKMMETDRPVNAPNNMPIAP